MYIQRFSDYVDDKFVASDSGKSITMDSMVTR